MNTALYLLAIIGLIMIVTLNAVRYMPAAEIDARAAAVRVTLALGVLMLVLLLAMTGVM